MTLVKSLSFFNIFILVLMLSCHFEGRLGHAFQLENVDQGSNPTQVYGNFSKTDREQVNTIGQRAKITQVKADGCTLRPCAATPTTSKSSTELSGGPGEVKSKNPKAFTYMEVKAGQHPKQLPAGRYVTSPIEEQISECHDCWAFVAVAAIESHKMLKLRTGKAQKSWLSSQQLVDCCVDCSPIPMKKRICNHTEGFVSKALTYLKGGIGTKNEYRQNGEPEKCRFKSPPRTEKIKDFTAIVGKDSEVIAALLEYGPLAIGLTERHYHNMKYDSRAKSCSGTSDRLFHYVLMVGYDEKKFYFADPWWGEIGTLERGVNGQFYSIDAITDK